MLSGLCQRLGFAGVDEFVEPFVLYHIGRLAYLQNDLDRAVSSLTDSLDKIRSVVRPRLHLYAINTLAAVHLKQGHLAKAAGLLREGRSLLTPGGCRSWFDASRPAGREVPDARSRGTDPWLLFRLLRVPGHR